ncbi:MAG: hypothetical protein Q7K37_07105 [Dehalococcoidia bacterium]|nr:hypothetical protein [Dehalococcoidia bacterium]
MAAIRLGDQMGGAQAPRRETMLRLGFGRTEAAATLAVLLYGAAAVILVGGLGLGAPEAIARTARLGNLWGGFEQTLIAFGFDRPPLISLLATPFAAFPALREGGLAAALATALTGGIAVHAAAGVAHRSGLSGPATVLFVFAFAFHPLLFFAGAVGLPETLYASLVLIALSQFGSWLHHESVASVIGAGVALGIAFVVRYDSIILAAVMGLAFWRVAAGRAARRDADADLAPMLAFGVPIVFVAGLWTMISWFPHGETGEFIRLAAELSRLGADDIAVLERMREFRDAPLLGLLWVARWGVTIAPLSALAILALLAWGARRRSREAIAMALVCTATLLPPAISVALGHGQPLVTHLFIAVVPAFTILGYREQGLTHGRSPDRYEAPRRRAQAAWCALLLVGSLGAAGVLAILPDTDRPAAAVRAVARGETVPAVAADVAAVAAWIRDNGGEGDYVVDINRHAEVMVATGDFSRFRTDADRSGEAIAYDPFRLAAYVLTRRPLPGQGEGRIEKPHPTLYADGSGFTELAFEAGEYRIYRVTGPALP